MADASTEAFTDVRIVTARSEYEHIQSERAMEFAHRNPFSYIGTPTEPITIRESVTITHDGEISVVLDAPDVSDDSMWKALDMVADAMYRLDGNAGTIQFGDPIQF